MHFEKETFNKGYFTCVSKNDYPLPVKMTVLLIFGNFLESKTLEGSLYIKSHIVFHLSIHLYIDRHNEFVLYECNFHY